MKKIIKKIVIFFIVLVFLFVLFMGVWAFFIFPNFIAVNNEHVENERGIAEIAEESEKVDFNESNGVLYVNNEVIVFVRESAQEKEISALFDSFKSEVDEAMADIGVYRLVFKNAMRYDELEALIKKIQSDPIVENAYLNTVTEFEADTTGEDDDFEYRDPAYPNDPWNGDSWEVGVPRGENWGMEAIDAPGAWGYLEQLSTVRIGLIDSMPDISHEDLSFANSSCLFIDENTKKIEVNTYTVAAEDHGTHVAGTMNAKWNNGAGASNDGVSGVMGGKGELYYSKAYYVSDDKAVDKYDTAYSYLLTLKTLIDQDVQVINISMNTSRLIGFAASRGNQNAINYLSMQADLTERGLSRIITKREAANKPDFVICVAAGNSNHLYYYKDAKAVYGYREEMTLWEKIKYFFGWRGERGNSLALYNNFLNLMDSEDVKNRIIVVGAVGIDKDASTSKHTQYEYAYYSNVGSRVDIVAPGGLPEGTQVYSCIVDEYGNMSGTSMAAPHVSGVAGLIFACNPSLSGPEVKDILISSAVGRYYHGGKYSGLLNANNSVVNALKTVDTSVEKVIKKETDNGLDLCFVVDTTGSMGDDIEDAKENMASILEHLASKTENYRVALIDYRDYPERTGSSEDYPYKIQLRFTNDNGAITNAIGKLDLGSGGDSKETVYSALISAVKLDWRSDAKKVIIILGDAAPLDPEPVTDLTYDKVILALFNADINIDYENSDERVTNGLDASLINVFSIGADAASDAEDFFENISASTGGRYASVDDASEVGDAIIDSIDQIEVAEKITVSADFGDAMANQRVNFYSGQEYLFTMETDEDGKLVIDSIEADTYRWTSNSLYSGGSIDISEDSREASVRVTKEYWFTPLLRLWHKHMLLICMILLVYLAVCIAVPVSVKNICARARQKKASAAAAHDSHTGQVQRTENVSPLEKSASAEAYLQCPNCGLQVTSKDRFCKQCGCNLQMMRKKITEHICKNCGHHYKDNEAYCGKCGTKIDKE